MAAAIKQSRTPVHNALRAPPDRKKVENRGKTGRISPRTRRHIAQKGKEGRITAQMTRNDLRLSIFVRCVQQIPSDATDCEFKKVIGSEADLGTARR